MNRTLSFAGALVSIALAFGILFTNPATGHLSGSAFSLADAAITSVPGLSARLETPPQNTAATSDGVDHVTFRFPHGGHDVSFKVRVTGRDRSYDADISRIWAGGEEEQKRKVRGYVQTYSRLPVIADLSRQLHRVKVAQGLDGDEYAEMIVGVVQSLPYDSPTGTEMRSPVGVLLAGKGDCDERALLTAAVLLHEGYGVGVFKFDAEQHAALAIRSTAARFKGTPYAFVEMTKPAYIGDDGTGPGASNPPQAAWSDPLVCPVGGSRQYGAGAQIAYILQRRTAAVRTMNRLAPRVQDSQTGGTSAAFQFSEPGSDMAQYAAASDALSTAQYGVNLRGETYRWLRAHP